MANRSARFDNFTAAYLKCALWSSTDNATPQGGEPLDCNYDVADIEPETLARMVADCEHFQNVHYDAISADLERAGHDFWLTRNGHGSGFWDGDWPEPMATVLTDACKAYGEYDLSVDGGRVYGFPNR